MLLKEFIKETLLSITQGVAEANKVEDRFQLSEHTHQSKAIEGSRVEFEVSIIASDTEVEGGKTGVGIQIANIFKAGADVNASSEKLNQSTHRLKFEVFVADTE